ncbi:MAG TPA: UDP binding domain-containing protein, partial [Sphingomicrobium sp.]
TKWNFLRFHPGLVGGHCIGVDPYYLTAKAEALGYRPEVILSGRRVNDGMGPYIGQQVVELMAVQGHPIQDSRVGILGVTFKENVPDIRNSKVVDIYDELRSFGIAALVHDPKADAEKVRELHGIELAPIEEFRDLAALIYAVPHDDYGSIEPAISDRIVQDGILIDIRARLAGAALRDDIRYWSL